MNITLYKGAVEAVLFAVGEPISSEKIADAIGIDKKTVRSLLDELRAEYEDGQRGICLLQMEDRYQLATRPVFADFITRALDQRRSTPLSQAAMEVLAIVAYNQPVSRPFIDQIRGVDRSSPVQSQLNKGLIVEAGRLDLPGKPVSFKTTDTFLRCFGLRNAGELPPIHSEELEYAYQGLSDSEDIEREELSLD
jgi:segregation and condensation protein B